VETSQLTRKRPTIAPPSEAHIQLARDPPNASRQAELGADDVERLDAADPERDMHRYEGDVQVV
jgi:hypothetical protein